MQYERSLPTTVGRMSQEIASQLLVFSEPEIRLGERGLITIGEALLGYGRVLFDDDWANVLPIEATATIPVATTVVMINRINPFCMIASIHEYE